MTLLLTRNFSYSLKTKLSTILLFTVSVVFSVLLSPYILEYVKLGIRLCYSSVIGSVFPFMIITDLIYSYADFNTFSSIKHLFEKLFKIDGKACGAFICGILCGFPLGVKVATGLYRDGVISKNECERLIGFSNNTGPAFIISGIGMAMRGSLQDGIILYFSMVISAILTGIIYGNGKSLSKSNTKHKQEFFELAESVKSAGLGTINICSFIIFFSVVCGILSLLIQNKIILASILPFIEISNAAKILSSIKILNNDLTLLLTSFAISFSGISVHLQARSYIYGTDISMKIYYLSKLMQGIISLAITFIIIIII